MLADSAVVTITDPEGLEVARLADETMAGINTVVWNTRLRADDRGGGRGGGGPLDRLAPLGEYTVTLDVGGTKRTRSARITGTQGWSLGPFPRRIR